MFSQRSHETILRGVYGPELFERGCWWHDEPDFTVDISRGFIAGEIIQRPTVVGYLSGAVLACNRTQHVRLQACPARSDHRSSAGQEWRPGGSTGAGACAGGGILGVLAVGVQGHPACIHQVGAKDGTLAEVHLGRSVGHGS